MESRCLNLSRRRILATLEQTALRAVSELTGEQYKERSPATQLTIVRSSQECLDVSSRQQQYQPTKLVGNINEVDLMTTLKRFLEVVLLFLGGLGAFGQTIQIGNLQIPMANVQPVDSNAIPEHGTFYLLQDCLNSRDAAPPCPDDPYPQYQAYSLGLDGLYLVDNTGIANETIEQILTPLFIIPDPNAPGAPPINWPVSPNGLQLVDPNNVPEFGTFYLYQDQFASDPPDPPPYPSVPEFALSASVYALSTNDQYLIDDTGMTRPDPEPTPEYSSPCSAKLILREKRFGIG
jgi:hypothetical protein